MVFASSMALIESSEDLVMSPSLLEFSAILTSAISNQYHYMCKICFVNFVLRRIFGVLHLNFVLAEP